MIEIKPIHTAVEHARLTERLLQLDVREDLSPEEEALGEVLTLLIEDYEEKYHPLPRLSPNESLRALMEERVLKHKDIWPVPGNKGAATDVLSGRRSNSLFDGCFGCSLVEPHPASPFHFE